MYADDDEGGTRLNASSCRVGTHARPAREQPAGGARPAVARRLRPPSKHPTRPSTQQAPTPARYAPRVGWRAL
eukprot:3088728-Alexandrium_andersonii.AAC.1